MCCDVQYCLVATMVLVFSKACIDVHEEDVNGASKKRCAFSMLLLQLEGRTRMAGWYGRTDRVAMIIAVSGMHALSSHRRRVHQLLPLICLLACPRLRTGSDLERRGGSVHSLACNSKQGGLIQLMRA